MSLEVVSAKAWRDEFRVTFDDGLVIRNARIPKKAPSTPAGVLRRAADIIDSKGLAKGTMRDGKGCRCLYAALLEAAGLGYDLDVPIDTGHLDARQIDMDVHTLRRFDVLHEALDMLGMPNAWGSITSVAPLARFSDKSEAWQIINLLDNASYGVKPKWEWRDIDKSEVILR